MTLSDSSHVAPTYELKRLDFVKPIEGSLLKHPPKVLNYFRQRENGCENRSMTRSLRLMLSAPFVKDWLRYENYCSFTLARRLMQRKLCAWEGVILEHLQKYGFEGIIGENPRCAKLLAEEILFNQNSALPLNFMEVLDIFYRIGVDFNSLDSHSRKNLSVKFIRCCRYDAGETSTLIFFNYLIERGVDINSEGNDTLLALCKTLRPLACKITCNTVELFRLLFAVKTIRRSNALTTFLRNLACGVNSKAAKIVQLFVENGCCTDEALEEFCTNDQSFRACLYSPKNMHASFLIYELLVERCSAYCIKNKIQHTPLLRLYDSFNSVRKIPRSIKLLSFVIEQGLHSNALYQADETLLTSLCRMYSKEDLPTLIEYLCSNSFNVNHLNYASQNALFNLSHNRLNRSNSPTVEEAVLVLIKHGINLNHRDKFGQSALNFFLNHATRQCCSYASLLLLEKWSYWRKLELLINAGCPVDCTLYPALSLFGKCNLCSKCALKYFGMAAKSGSIATPGLLHFQRFLRFIELILKRSADFSAEFRRIKFNSPIIYVCAHYKGEELVALARLLCEHGIDVNAQTMARPKTCCHSLRTVYRRPKNAIQVLCIENESEIGRIGELLDIFLTHGFLP